jgi:Fe-S-cluster containining protein
MTIRHRSYFFDPGILFECRQCGACCTGDPGIVHVYHDEVESIARYLSEGVLSFIEKYLYTIKGEYGIKEHADGQCYFYQDGCTIYPVRPGQCRTFPFWFENLRSWKKWRQVSKACPGIGSGKLYSKEQILKIINSTFVDHVNNIP